MVGKMTLNKILIGIISIVFLVSSCQIEHYYVGDISIKDITGTYVFNHINFNDEIVESDTLELYEDGSYNYHTYLKYHDLTGMDVYPATGVWRISENYIILNSIFPCDDDSCFVKEIESDSLDDNLIVVEMILLSSGMPLRDYTVFSVYDEQFDTLEITDSCGRVYFYRDHTTAIDISDPNGMRIVSPPRKGFMYRAYYRDCYIRTHNNKKLVIKGNTLLLSERGVAGYSKFGWKKYRTYEYPFIKVADTTVFRKK